MGESSTFLFDDFFNKNTNLLILASDQKDVSVKKSNLLTINYDYFIKVFQQFELLSKQGDRETRDASVQTDATEKIEVSTQTDFRLKPKTSPTLNTFDKLNKYTTSIRIEERNEMRPENTIFCLTNKDYDHNKNRSLFKPYQRQITSASKNNMIRSQSVKHYENKMYQLQEKIITNQRRSSSSLQNSPTLLSSYGITTKINGKYCLERTASSSCCADQRKANREQDEPIDFSIRKTDFQIKPKTNNSGHLINAQNQTSKLYRVYQNKTTHHLDLNSLRKKETKKTQSKSLKNNQFQSRYYSHNTRRVLPKMYPLAFNQLVAESLKQNHRLLTETSSLRTSKNFDKVYQKNFVINKELFNVLDLTGHK